MLIQYQIYLGEDSTKGGYGWSMVDQLDYSYNAANQLTFLTDANDQDGGIKYSQSQFDYDLNGNLTKDPGKNISQIDYNYLNNPGFVGNGKTAGGTREYVIPNQKTLTRSQTKNY